MTKAELINAVAQKTELSKKDSEKAVVAVIDAISEALAAGEKVALVGFGTFEVKERAAREGINPRTKEKIEIPASKQAKPSKRSFPSKQTSDDRQQLRCAGAVVLSRQEEML